MPTDGQQVAANEIARAELRRVCDQVTTGDHEYFGVAVLGQLDADLRHARTGTADATRALTNLGMEKIRLGRFDEALRHFEAAARQVETLSADSGTKLSEVHAAQRELPRILIGQALAHLQQAEDENCLRNHSARSCILPIADEAVHAVPEPANAAAEVLHRLLAVEPDNIRARWLLNLSRMITGDHPDGVPEAWRTAPGAFAGAAFPEWRDSASDLGVAAVDLAGGAVLDDYDGDGLLDLISSSSDPCAPLKAYRNKGDGEFEDVSIAWGLDAQLGGLNLVHADYNGDGQLDLLVLRGGWWGRAGRMRNSLLRNDLHGEAGRFVDVTAAVGIAYPAFPTQTAAWADFDRDGDLDLYVGNEATASSTEPLTLFGHEGEPYASQLFRNEGPGPDGEVRFTDIARAAGVRNLRFTKGVTWGDYDDDGDPDLYVSNIGPNRLYRNDGPGADGEFRFTDVAGELQVTEPAGLSFACWFFDYDNDGDLDLFVADYGSPIEVVAASFFGATFDGSTRQRVYRNDGGRFVDASRALGLTGPLLPMGANYGDLDNDGWLDFYLGTGVPNFDALMPNAMYRNVAGNRFEDVTFAGGFGHLQKGHGVAFGDLDNDGDQDLFEQLGGAYPYDVYGNALYLNPGLPASHRWLTLRLQAAGANRFAIGARVEIRIRQRGETRSVHHLVGSGGSFGASSLQLEAGLGDAEAIDAVIVRWPGSGRYQEFRGVEVDRFYRAVEGKPRLEPLDLPRIRLDTGSPHHHHSSSTESEP